MIQVYKIVNGYYDKNVCPNLIKNLDTRTRGNTLKLTNRRSNIDIRKYSFCFRIVNLWNSLPENVVTVDSINGFKNSLDKHWGKNDAFYDWEVSVL